MKVTEWYLFLLAALLIAAVYYVGVRSDLQSLTNLVTSIFNTSTGRDSAGGPFQNYPNAQIIGQKAA